MTQLEDLQQFSIALHHAIRDRRLEDSGVTVRLFYDADAAIAAICGLSVDDAVSVDVTALDSRPLARALCSAGWLPQIYFLRPHLLELSRVLEGLPQQPEREGKYERVYRTLRQRWSLDAYAADIAAIASDPEQLALYFQREGFQLFTRLELCYGGDWSQRVRRFLRERILIFLPFGSPVDRDTVYPHDLTSVFGAWLKRHRDEELSINLQMDAFALAELSWYVKEGHEVRFYTETEALRRIGNDRQMLDRLGTSAHGVESPMIDTEYLLLRVSFRALAFASRAGNRFPSNSDDVAFADIETFADLSKEIAEVLSRADPKADDAQVQEAMLRHHVAGRDLLQFWRELHSFKYLADLLTADMKFGDAERVQQLLPRVVPDKEALLQTMEASAFRKRKKELITSAFDEVRDEIAFLRSWRECYAALAGAVSLRRREFGGESPDIWRDMGLARWGYQDHLVDAQKRELEEFVAEIAVGRPADELTAELAYSFGQFTTLRPSTAIDQRQVVTLAIKLFWLRSDRLVTELWHRTDADTAKHSVLALPYYVSRVRMATATAAGQGGSVQEALASVFASARKGMNADSAVSPRSQAFYSMALAHVAYWAWDASGRRRAGQGAGFDYAVKSFALAEAAFRIFDEDPGSLEWAFAINHCAYMGLVADIEPRKRAEYLKRLTDNVPPWCNHYRFSDTLAWRHRIEADRIEARLDSEANTGGMKDAATLRKRGCFELSAALNFLTKRPNFGDHEVHRHLERITTLARTFECEDLRRAIEDAGRTIT